MHVGILFADLRGFTARFDGGDPEEGRPYRGASTAVPRTFSFPLRSSTKLIDDEVMALYPPT